MEKVKKTTQKKEKKESPKILFRAANDLSFTHNGKDFHYSANDELKNFPKELESSFLRAKLIK